MEVSLFKLIWAVEVGGLEVNYEKYEIVSAEEGWRESEGPDDNPKDGSDASAIVEGNLLL